MREVKFRFWDTKKRIWCGWEISGWINIVNKDDPRQVVTIQPKTDDVITMQYTGLKDKKGMEIFEGDIIKTWDIKIKGEIVFENGRIFIKGKRNPKHYPEGTSHNFKTVIPIEKNEIIGNIYENPELLLETK